MRIAPALKDGGYYAASLRAACPLQEHVLNVLLENGQSRVDAQGKKSVNASAVGKHSLTCGVISTDIARTARSLRFQTHHTQRPSGKGYENKHL
jgi:hypothetical protein